MRWLALIGMFAVACNRNQSAPPAPGVTAVDPEIASVVGAVSAANLMQSVSTLAAFGTRNSCSNNGAGATTGIGAARDFIQKQFQSVPGVQVMLDPFTINCPSGAQTDQNVVAFLPGKKPTRFILVTGHYDSRTLNVTDGVSPAPGANDSGSQTGLVLEAARVLAGHSFDATLVFVAFAGEEQGLVGSRHFATAFAGVSGGTIEAVLNCDIVGGDRDVNTPATLQQFRLYSPGTPREILSPDGSTDDTSPARGVMRFVAAWGGAYVPDMAIVPKLREDRPGRGSDHEAFLEQAIPGVRFIETIESPDAGTLASHQHSPNDLPMYVSPDYAARVARVVVATAASLARAPSAPASVSAGGTAAQLTLTWTAPPPDPPVDHFVVAARDVGENFYRSRVIAPASALTSLIAAADLGLAGSPAFFVSVAAADAQGHESLFAYPELRCDAGGCVVPAAALDVKAKN